MGLATLAARAAAVLALLPGAPCVLAQSYPAKPVRLIIPFAPGGSAEAFARKIAREQALRRDIVRKQKLSLDQP